MLPGIAPRKPGSGPRRPPISQAPQPETRSARKPGARELQKRPTAAPFGTSGGAGHQQPDALAIGVTRVEDGDQLASIDDSYTVGEREHLIELGGNQQYSEPLVALAQELAVDEFDRAYIDASSRLACDQELGQSPQLAGHDQFLLVAPRQRADQLVRVLNPDVERLDEPLCVGADRVELPDEPARVRGMVMIVKHQVVGN